MTRVEPLTSPSAYLDWNATAPLLPAARAAMVAALETGGNPSAVHRHGRAARRILEDARAAVAAAFGAAPKEIVFTSGATEANNLALKGLAGAVSKIFVSAIEHPSVLEAARHGGPPVEVVPVTAEGAVDLTALAAQLAATGGKALIAVMAANNETGVIQPVAEIVALARAHGALVHCDAVQIAGKAPLSFADLGGDTLALSAHKMGGPTGIGALLVREDTPLAAQLHGGGQERRRRAGTENVAGIAGFGAAAAMIATLQSEMIRIAALRDALEDTLLKEVPDGVVFGRGAARLANTSAFALPGVKADLQVVALDLEGVAVSAGAACSSGKVARSHVLDAMGAGALADNAIRISLGWATRDSDIEAFLSAYLKIANRRVRASEPERRAAAGVS